MTTSIRNLSILLGITTFAAPALAGDFNGDGRDDLATAVTLTNGTYPVGAVSVLYANASGLSSTGTMTLTEQTTPNAGDADGVDFGLSIAIGDFDHDGFDDLAVGAPFAHVKKVFGAGTVNLFRGTANGLVPNGFLHQNSSGMKDKCEPNEDFGWSLAAGDFNGDGYCDLAIGVFEKIGKAKTAGAVHVVYGSKKGLNANKDQIWSQDSKGVEGLAEESDNFGEVMAAGDADGDGYDDLMIGVPGEIRVHNGVEVHGSIAFLRGSKKGLTSKNDALFDAFDVNSSNFDPTGGFGAALAFADFDHNGSRHLVVGAPGWDLLAANSDDGVVFLIPVTPTTIDLAHYSSLAIGDSCRFGAALSVGKFNNDDYEDLAVGLPYATYYPGVQSAGAIQVFDGSATGIDTNSTHIFTRNSSQVLGDAVVGANFGATLAAGDFDGNGQTDLAVAAPWDSIGSAQYCGGVNVLRGISTGLTAVNSQWWFGAPFGAPASWQMFGLHMGS